MHFLFFLNPKFSASSNLLCLYSWICVRPVRKPHNLFSHDTAQIMTQTRYELRHVKTGYCLCKNCLCENKVADQLCSNCTADHCLCFLYTNSKISLLKSDISSFKPSSVTAGAWLGIRKTGFLVSRHVSYMPSSLVFPVL